MIDQNFTGRWTGEYIYGEDYPETIRGKRVAFEIDLTLANGMLQGYCTDEEVAAHFNQPAVIEGSILQNCISFIKRYPCYWQVQEYNGPRIMPKLPSQEVQYSGCFSEGRFEGEWEIVTVLTEDNGDIHSYKCMGYWSMQKL